MTTQSERRWTIYVCPECDHVQGHGGRCRNAFTHAPDERVLLEAVVVVPETSAAPTCGAADRVALLAWETGTEST